MAQRDHNGYFAISNDPEQQRKPTACKCGSVDGRCMNDCMTHHNSEEYCNWANRRHMHFRMTHYLENMT